MKWVNEITSHKGKYNFWDWHHSIAFALIPTDAKIWNTQFVSLKQIQDYTQETMAGLLNKNSR